MPIYSHFLHNAHLPNSLFYLKYFTFKQARSYLSFEKQIIQNKFFSHYARLSITWSWHCALVVERSNMHFSLSMQCPRLILFRLNCKSELKWQVRMKRKENGLLWRDSILISLLHFPPPQPKVKNLQEANQWWIIRSEEGHPVSTPAEC